MSNRLKNETSPYLLQHAENPVNWFPWCNEAFQKAKEEDKPIFLSIGYSTCHWCHVMAHESFEDEKTASFLNKNFVCIKVDKEERPDIDSIYMSVCQAFTGSGGWPTSIFMTHEQKPFFAGTYFPKKSYGGMISFLELLSIIIDKWNNERELLLSQADEVINLLKQNDSSSPYKKKDLPSFAVKLYKKIYDKENGGFGHEPKFPSPHNILFLLDYYETYKDNDCLVMAELTLIQMYRGGLFDHIGYGFCRYSTDKIFLVPHFEKMLYDNALLILAYSKAYSITQKKIYMEIAEKTAAYILREMTQQDGGFYSAQDADVDGEEGKFYLFTPDEIIKILGKDCALEFNKHFDITKKGNFEGKNIPNLLNSDFLSHDFDKYMITLYDYRKKRYNLHTDDKILTLWNSLMIAAMCSLYQITKSGTYLTAAKDADNFIEKNLMDGDTIFVSSRCGKRGLNGFLDDYAAYIFAKIGLYNSTLEENHLKKAVRLARKVIADFADKDGGFFLYSKSNEELILHPKDTYDGAMPSGNSLMAWNLVYLSELTQDEEFIKSTDLLLDYLEINAQDYPIGYSMFLSALLMRQNPPKKITVVPAKQEILKNLQFITPFTLINLLDEPTEEFPLKNGKTTYYVCQNHTCQPPVNNLPELK